MVKKGSIVFTSTYSYLSNPQYYSFVKDLNDFKTIYFHVRDPQSAKFDDERIKKSEILDYFDEYVKLDYALKEELEKLHSRKKTWFDKFRLSILKPYRIYKQKLIEKLTELNPLAIITCSDMTISDRIISHWCIRNKREHLILQTSFIDNVYCQKPSLKLKMRYLFFNKFLGLPIYRRQHLFGSENQKSHLLLWSEYFVLDPKRRNTYFIGNAVLDNLFKLFSPEKKETNIITICTQPIDVMFNEEKFKEVVEIYITAIEKNPDLKFFIKVHPRECIEKYRTLFPKQKFSNAEVVKDCDLRTLLQQSMAQISVSSFTSFEALAMGVPIITINPNNAFNLLDNFREEVDIRVRTPAEILQAIEAIRSADYWEQFLIKRELYFKKTLHYIDGKSKERTIETIKEIILKK